MAIKKILAIYLLVLVLMSPQSVLAEDYILMVPVNLTNLEEAADGVKVICNLSSTIISVDDSWGSWDFILPIPPSRSINTTLEARIHVVSYRNPARVTNYQCDFMLRKTGSGAFNPPKTSCSPSDPDLYLCALDGTLIGSVQGTFP